VSLPNLRSDQKPPTNETILSLAKFNVFGADKSIELVIANWIQRRVKNAGRGANGVCRNAA
jgi:hypothetical protein